ncbi:MAG TPA: aminomethyltransferase, partial [Verrucomicrobiae bacterium]|nr:aminomethyltransferase [Verrucomicrobiae bacterium]
MNLALATRPRLIEPGLPRLQPGVERYRVPGGGAVVLALLAGDRLEITDVEGRQRAELAAFTPAGREDSAALGLSAAGPAVGINRLLAGTDDAARAVTALLKARGLPGAIAKAADLFQHDSRPGETVALTAARDCILIIHAGGNPMG